jgi:hypothetical protein
MVTNLALVKVRLLHPWCGALKLLQAAHFRIRSGIPMAVTGTLFTQWCHGPTVCPALNLNLNRSSQIAHRPLSPLTRVIPFGTAIAYSLVTKRYGPVPLIQWLYLAVHGCYKTYP